MQEIELVRSALAQAAGLGALIEAGGERTRRRPPRLRARSTGASQSHRRDSAGPSSPKTAAEHDASPPDPSSWPLAMARAARAEGHDRPRPRRSGRTRGAPPPQGRPRSRPACHRRSPLGQGGTAAQLRLRHRPEHPARLRRRLCRRRRQRLRHRRRPLAPGTEHHLPRSPPTTTRPACGPSSPCCSPQPCAPPTTPPTTTAAPSDALPRPPRRSRQRRRPEGPPRPG